MKAVRRAINTVAGTTCRHAHELMSEQMDGPLTFGARFRLRVHLTICAACRRVEKQMEFMRSAIRRIGQ